MKLGLAALFSIAMATTPAVCAAQTNPAPSVSKENVEAIVRDGLRRFLKDPSSADLRITKGPFLGTVTTKHVTETGYLACGELNAKNSYGAFVGVKDYLFVIDPQSGQVKPLERLDQYLFNADAWRKVCYLSPPEIAAAPAPASL